MPWQNRNTRFMVRNFSLWSFVSGYGSTWRPSPNPCQGRHSFPPSSTLTPEDLHPFPSPAPPSLLRLRGAPICIETDPRGKSGLFGQGSGVPVMQGEWAPEWVCPCPQFSLAHPALPAMGRARALRKWWGLHSCWPSSACFSPLLVCFHLSGVILFIYCFHMFIINLPYSDWCCRKATILAL